MSKRKAIETGRIAYADARGVIGFGEVCPKGTLPIIRCKDKEAEDHLAALARLAYDGKTLLVPGIPEAPDQTAGIEALISFQRWVVKAFDQVSP